MNEKADSIAIKTSPIWTPTGDLRWLKIIETKHGGGHELVLQYEWRDIYTGTTKWKDVSIAEAQVHHAG